MESEWIFGRLAGGRGVDSLGSGYGLVEGCCKYGAGPAGSGATELDIQKYYVKGRPRRYFCFTIKPVVMELE
jgi:hypothetical protein